MKCMWTMLILGIVLLSAGCNVPETREVNGLVKVVVDKVEKGDQAHLVSQANGALVQDTIQHGDTIWVMADTTAKSGHSFYIGAGCMIFTTLPSEFTTASVVSGGPFTVHTVSADHFDVLSEPPPLACTPNLPKECRLASSVRVIIQGSSGQLVYLQPQTVIKACLPVNWPPFSGSGFKPWIPAQSWIQFKYPPPGGTMVEGIIQDPVELMIN